MLNNNSFISIKEAINYGLSNLINVDIYTDYRLDVRILLAHASNISKEEIMLYPENNVSQEAFTRFKFYIERRRQGEPVSKILERREFWGMDFKVTRDTLDPRPDSETMIEAVLSLIPNKEQKFNILDLGTGTACLLLSILKEYRNAQGIGIDISEKAIEIAKYNSEALGFTDRADFITTDWHNFTSDYKFDIIISNPPYIKEQDKHILQTEVSGFDPHIALFAGEDGLDCYRSLSDIVRGTLADIGYVFLEIGIGQKEQIISIMHNFKLHSIHQDLQGIERVLVFEMIYLNHLFQAA